MPAAKVSKKVNLKFQIKCDQPVKDSIFDLASFEKFLNDRIKINGKTGVLGEDVVLTRDSTSIRVNAKTAFSKRYLKYLTKKFLKKQQLRDYIRVVSDDKKSYTLRYFQIDNNEES